jgi:type II secretory pathway pseudopilin PulG
MRRMMGNQGGSGLLLLIGIIATLAILAASLVVVVGNMQHSGQRDRLRAKAFNVTEAALDSGMAALSTQWPAASGTGPDLGTTAQTAFRSEFSSSEYPAATTGLPFVIWQYYDNQDPIDPTITWDKGSPANPDVPDNRVWLVAQSSVGNRAARVQTLVERTYFDAGVPRGVALYAGGNLLSNGGGNNPKIMIEVPPPVGTQTTVRVGGYIDDPTVSAENIVDLSGSAAGTVDQVFPLALREGLKAVAQAHGRYFTSEDAAYGSPADPNWSPAGGISGLTVIESPTGANVSLRAGVWNSEANPGILMVLGGGNIDFAGSGDYWGAMYTDGTVDKGHGNFTVHGMVVAASLVDLRGTVNIHYNDNVISRLATRWSLNVRVVPNTWRELKPQ